MTNLNFKHNPFKRGRSIKDRIKSMGYTICIIQVLFFTNIGVCFSESDVQNILEITIPTETKIKFEKFVKQNKMNPYENPKRASQIMGDALRRLLPSHITASLLNMGKDGSPGIVFIKGLPIDEHISQEDDIEKRVTLKGRVSENLMLGLSDVMNCEARANPKEQGGKIIHNISPVKGYIKTKSSKGRDPFYLHTENPFETSPPDFLLLYGLEGDSNAKTTYFFVENLISSFPEWVKKGMKSSEFHIRSGKGLDVTEQGVFPLISQEDQKGKLRLRLYQDMERIRPTTANSTKVLDYIALAMKPIKPEGISLNLGEAIIINNGWGLNKISGIMHGRGGFIENPQRWIQRAFLYRKESIA